MSLAVWIWRRGTPDVAGGVLGGGALIWTSYWAIKRGVDALVVILAPGDASGGSASATPALASGPPGPLRQPAPQSGSAPKVGVAPKAGIAWTLVKFVGRYALLGLMAYVMIAQLRLDPIGLLLGASSVVAAATIEAVRSVVVSWGPSRR